MRGTVLCANKLIRRFALIVILWACSHRAIGMVPFDRVVIDTSGPRDPWIKIVGDINGDKSPDVVIGGQAGPLVWYAYPKWTKTVVARGGYSAVDGELGDVDADGDMDIVMGGVIWYENPRPEGNPGTAPWGAHRIGIHNSHDVEVGDLDGDTDLDVVTRDQSGFGHNAGNKIHLWKQEAPTSWVNRIIDCPHGEGLKLADMDRDGDPDIAIAGRWYENTRDAPEGPWAEHVFSTTWTHGDVKVEVGDINRDGRPDIVLAPAEGVYRFSWFEGPSNPKAGEWTEHVIEGTADGIHSLQAADMDANGTLDIIIAKMHQYKAPHEVSIYAGDGKGLKWTKQVVGDKGSHNICVADIGNDGDLDIIGANWSGPYQPIELWESKMAIPKSRPDEKREAR